MRVESPDSARRPTADFPALRLTQSLRYLDSARCLNGFLRFREGEAPSEPVCRWLARRLDLPRLCCVI